MPLNENQKESKSDVIGDFFAIIRDHCINVLMRMTPEKRSYYKLVWEHQKPEDLLTYKLPQVYEEVPSEGIEEEDREYMETLTVTDYFKKLLGFLDEKLFMNIPIDEKQDLDIKKFIWTGDTIQEEPKEVTNHLSVNNLRASS